jgi:hypothetical protein
MKFNTPIKIHYSETDKDEKEIFHTVESEFLDKIVDIFYCEWTGTFGNQVLQNQAIGVIDVATIRIRYNPDVYQALRDKNNISIAKNAVDIFKLDRFGNSTYDRKNINCYMIFGDVDNIKEENRIIEFKVRRYEQK